MFRGENNNNNNSNVVINNNVFNVIFNGSVTNANPVFNSDINGSPSLTSTGAPPPTPRGAPPAVTPTNNNNAPNNNTPTRTRANENTFESFFQLVGLLLGITYAVAGALRLTKEDLGSAPGMSVPLANRFPMWLWLSFLMPVYTISTFTSFYKNIGITIDLNKKAIETRPKHWTSNEFKPWLKQFDYVMVAHTIGCLTGFSLAIADIVYNSENEKYAIVFPFNSQKAFPAAWNRMVYIGYMTGMFSLTLMFLSHAFRSLHFHAKDKLPIVGNKVRSYANKFSLFASGNQANQNNPVNPPPTLNQPAVVITMPPDRPVEHHADDGRNTLEMPMTRLR